LTLCAAGRRQKGIKTADITTTHLADVPAGGEAGNDIGGDFKRVPALILIKSEAHRAGAGGIAHYRAKLGNPELGTVEFS